MVPCHASRCKRSLGYGFVHIPQFIPSQSAPALAWERTGQIIGTEGDELNEEQTTSERMRIEQLEGLVSRLRHDLRGAITPAALVGDQLRNHSDPSMQRAGVRINEMVQRVLEKLEETYQHVPPREPRKEGLRLG